ncbi:ribonuclease H-like domain-containing protein, partial [Tanacetum coccineum]
KRHVTLSRSSAEAEYRGVANVVAETATLVYYDNVSAVYLSTNPVQHQRTKHIEIHIHFVREYVASGQGSYSTVKRKEYILKNPSLWLLGWKLSGYF